MNWTLRLVIWVLASMILKMGATEPPDFADASQRNEDAVYNHLLTVANSCRKPMRVYYDTLCSKEKPPEFPSVTVQPPGKNKMGLDEVREIFAKDKNVKVTEDGGIIRIWIGKVPTAILQAKLSRLALTPRGQYNPGVAFYELLNSKDMLRTEQTLKYKPPLTYSNLLIEPDEKLPHLPATLRNTTAEEVLDKMAKTWAGEVIVIYGVCGEKDESGETRFWLEWQGQMEGDPRLLNH